LPQPRASYCLDMTSRRFLLVLGITALVAGGVIGSVLLGESFDADTSPARIVIAVDAGHGGSDPGVVVDDIHEADVNLEIATRLRAHLAEDPRITVIMTRGQDLSLSHEQRIAIAERGKASAYVSIQANAFGSPAAHGIETWVDEDQHPGSASWSLAEVIQGALVSGTGGRDRGVRSMGLYLGKLRCPAVLVEVGFLTNPSERRMLLSAQYQETVAANVAKGILSMVDAL